MSSSAKHLRPIDADNLPEYPISSEDRLDSHYFIQWNTKRWRKSRFRQLADPEVGWAGFQLFCEAHDETPVGTLPTDDLLLARAANVSLEKWKELCARPISPLHNWHPVRCDNGEIKLAHKVVTLVTQEALKSNRKNRDNLEQQRRAKRIKDLRAMIEDRIGAKQLLRMGGFLESFNDWLEDRYPDMQRRESFIRRAIEEFQAETGS